MSTFQIFPNFGHRKSNFSQIQNSPHYPRGGGGQKNYGLFPQFVTFHVWKAPLRLFCNMCTHAQCHVGYNDNIRIISCLFQCGEPVQQIANNNLIESWSGNLPL